MAVVTNTSLLGDNAVHSTESQLIFLVSRWFLAYPYPPFPDDRGYVILQTVH
jgi:hypothetical protein